MDVSLKTSLSQNWGWMALRGLSAILFGVLALVWPFAAIEALVLVWAAYALVDGIFSLIAGIKLRKTGSIGAGSLMIIGGLGILAGIVAFLWPGLTATSLLVLIAVWAIIIGAMQIMAAIKFRQVLMNEWWLILSGCISVLFGILMIANPGGGALALIWVIGGYAIFFGVFLVFFAWRMRSAHKG